MLQSLGFSGSPSSSASLGVDGPRSDIAAAFDFNNAFSVGGSGSSSQSNVKGDGTGVGRIDNKNTPLLIAGAAVALLAIVLVAKK